MTIVYGSWWSTAGLSAVNVSISPKPRQASEHIGKHARGGKKSSIIGLGKKYLEENTITYHLTQKFCKTIAGCNLMVTRSMVYHEFSQEIYQAWF